MAHRKLMGGCNPQFWNCGQCTACVKALTLDMWRMSLITWSEAMQRLGEAGFNDEQAANLLAK
jgi:hypothetical protein